MSIDLTIEPGDVIKLDTGKFEDLGSFVLKEIKFTPNSTAVRLKVLDSNNELQSKVVAYHQIYK